MICVATLLIMPGPYHRIVEDGDSERFHSLVTFMSIWCCYPLRLLGAAVAFSGSCRAVLGYARGAGVEPTGRNGPQRGARSPAFGSHLSPTLSEPFQELAPWRVFADKSEGAMLDHFARC